jgi:hypothetical protein
VVKPPLRWKLPARVPVDKGVRTRLRSAVPVPELGLLGSGVARQAIARRLKWLEAVRQVDTESGGMPPGVE